MLITEAGGDGGGFFTSYRFDTLHLNQVAVHV